MPCFPDEAFLKNKMKKTKIVVTVGPASESVEILEKLLREGMNIMRLNFSHGDVAEHQARLDNFRTAQKNTGIAGEVLQDLSGPKIRLGDFAEGEVLLIAGQNIIITTEQIVGDVHRVSVNYPQFPREVKVGEAVMLDDGRKKLQVERIDGEEVTCTVVVGGNIKNRRGVNLPDSKLSVKALTEKDMKDLEFGVTNAVDYVALSFVREASDIVELRDALHARGSTTKIIAKIETPQAIANIDAIISAVDGAMVARGDLGIEEPYEKVPMFQKMIIKKCNEAGKFVITATQMLESMVENPTPTRAEVSDIADAILEGTDALMLSEETALGAHPVEAVQVMTRVALEVEGEMRG